MKKIKTTEKKVGIKNYFILILIFATGILLTLYLCNVYKVYDESKKQIPVIRGTLSEIKYEELEHYISENPTTVIYMCTASNEVCRNYEKDLKKLIKKEELQEEIVYLNLSETNNSEFTEMFNKKYPFKVKITDNYPAIVIFIDGKITNILQAKRQEKLTITKTQQFIDLHMIGE